jgi:beta-phosphoglucomutase
VRGSGRRISKKELDRVFVRKQRIFRRYFKRFIFAGVPETLAGLKARGFALGLVTGTPLEEVRHILPARLFRKFDAVVCGDMVKRGKPFPDPYLTAARSLGVAPRDCLVVENAHLGIRSAKAAGMFCCALTTSLPKEYLKGADAVIDDIFQLDKVIMKWVKK